MQANDKKRHVFIVRIWLESREVDNRSPVWRGQIEAVNTGQKQAIEKLTDINEFIAPHLAEMGVHIDLITK